jgi:hypothetical protein
MAAGEEKRNGGTSLLVRYDHGSRVRLICFQQRLVFLKAGDRFHYLWGSSSGPSSLAFTLAAMPSWPAF